jgi:hypothetical protein
LRFVSATDAHPMPDTPPLASLLDQWTRGGQMDRFRVYAHLRDGPAAAAAIEHSFRDHLNDKLPVARVRAAEAVLIVYGDEPAARDALVGALRTGEPSAAASAAVLVRRLSAPYAAPVLVELALHAEKTYHGQTPEFVRWAGETAARAGTGFRELLNHTDAERESELLVGLAVAAPSVEHPLCDLEPDLRARLFHTGPGYAAGAALWRVSWRVNRDWLNTLNPDSPRLAGNADLLNLLVDVVCEHLGRRPEFVPLARALLVRLAAEAPDAVPPALARVERLGTRGWAVLLPLLGEPAAGADARAHLFRAAARAPVRALAQHHSQALVAERLTQVGNKPAVPNELLAAACELLAALGPAAGFALPQLLDLAAVQPYSVPHTVAAVRALAPGYPLARAAVARALSRVRGQKGYDAGAFRLLAQALAEIDFDAGPALANDPSIDSRVPDALLQHEAWANAPPGARAKHARYVAHLLAAPRAETRVLAAELLRHYPDHLPAVWPALVAALAGSDERAALAVLPLFRHLAPVADEVEPELLHLFDEPSVVRAARAAIALWRLGRFAVIAPHLRRELSGAPDDSRGWDLLTALANRADQSHGVLHAIEAALAGAPDETRERVRALLYPPESLEEAALSACVNEGAAPGARVSWQALFRAAGTEPECAFLALALMCAFGAEGTAPVKILLIKHQRAVAFNYLAESKLIVERCMDRLLAGASADERRERVREFCGDAPQPPQALLALLNSKVNWFRWAGLELLDAWGAPELVPGLIADRLWDRCPRVRSRALRMQ